MDLLDKCLEGYDFYSITDPDRKITSLQAKAEIIKCRNYGFKDEYIGGAVILVETEFGKKYLNSLEIYDYIGHSYSLGVPEPKNITK